MPTLHRHAHLCETGEATAELSFADASSGSAGGSSLPRPIRIVGTHKIRSTFDDLCMKQTVNSARAPGVSNLVLNPDAHCGYGAPVGCVLVSPSHIYPGPVGVDIKCSMSLLQLDAPADAIDDKRTRRAIIDAICERTPTGAGKGQRHVPKSRPVSSKLGEQVITEGASASVCEALGIPAGMGSTL